MGVGECRSGRRVLRDGGPHPLIPGPAGKIPAVEFNFLPLPTQLDEQMN